jgi:hypothetical protein
MRRGLLRPWWAAALLLLAWAFVTAVPSPADAQGQRGVPIAMLLVAGPSVTVNGRPAINGMTIARGDHVTTGPASSARLDFYSGGSVQLDANTDPDFFGALIRIVTGQMYSAGDATTVDVSDGVSLFAQSAFNLRVGPGNDVLTVVSGHVSVVGGQEAAVPGGTQAVIAGGRIVARRVVSPAEMGQITAWRYQYRFSRPGPANHPAPQPYRPAEPRRQYYPNPVPPSYQPGQDPEYRRPAPPRESYPPIRRTWPPPTTNPRGSYQNQPVTPPSRRTWPRPTTNPGGSYQNPPVTPPTVPRPLY